MRIAYICADSGVPVFGTKGCSIHIEEFVRALLARRAEVSLYASRIGGVVPPSFEALAVRHLPIDRSGRVEERERAALAANEGWRHAIEAEGPFDLVYERYSLFSFAGMEYARAIGVPGVLEVNAPLIEEQSQYRQLVDRESAERATRRVFESASLLVAVSEEVAEYLRRYPESEGRIEIVPNGVDAHRFAPRAEVVSSRGDGFTIGFVGSLKPWHGLSDLIAAFAALSQEARNARLLIVGDGPERSWLEETIAAAEFRDSVRLTGAVPHREVPALLAAIDVAVAPYPKLTNFYFSPLKVFEYMAAGLPVVASRTGQVAKLIEDGVTGLLYEPGDVRALSGALDRLRQQPEFRKALGRAARESILKGHTWDAAVERILQSGHRRHESERRGRNLAS
jgi:glycosyltransferase involved in cell wall biosynthesis